MIAYFTPCIRPKGLLCDIIHNIGLKSTQEISSAHELFHGRDPGHRAFADFSPVIYRTPALPRVYRVARAIVVTSFCFSFCTGIRVIGLEISSRTLVFGSCNLADLSFGFGAALVFWEKNSRAYYRSVHGSPNAPNLRCQTPVI